MNECERGAGLEGGGHQDDVPRGMGDEERATGCARYQGEDGAEAALQTRILAPSEGGISGDTREGEGQDGRREVGDGQGADDRRTRAHRAGHERKEHVDVATRVERGQRTCGAEQADVKRECSVHAVWLRVPNRATADQGAAQETC